MSRPGVLGRDQALCLYVTPEVFFRVGDKGPARKHRSNRSNVSAPNARGGSNVWIGSQNGIDIGIWGGQHRSKAVLFGVSDLGMQLF